MSVYRRLAANSIQNQVKKGRCPKTFWPGLYVVITMSQISSHKGKGIHELKAQTARGYPRFISMKHLGVLLLPPGWNASPLQGYPLQYT